MRNEIYESVKQTVKNWWVSLVIGVLALIVGVWSMTTPDVTLVALTYVFIFTFFLTGIFEIIFAVSNKDTLSGWGWTLAGGIIDIVFGILILTLPPIVAAVTLVYFVGFWIIFRCIWMIGESMELKKMNVNGWGWLLALAILGVLFGITFLISPLFTGAVFIVAFVAVAFIIYGIFRIYMAFRMRSINQDIKKIEGR